MIKEDTNPFSSLKNHKPMWFAMERRVAEAEVVAQWVKGWLGSNPMHAHRKAERGHADRNPGKRWRQEEAHWVPGSVKRSGLKNWDKKGGWKDSLEVKNACYSCRGPEFSSQHPHRVVPAPGEFDALFWPLRGPALTRTTSTHIFIKKNIKWGLERWFRG